MKQVRGPGRAIVAMVFLIVGGTLNFIYGIAAISNSNFFAHDAHYFFGNLKTWGWVSLVIGFLELLAATSLVRGGTFGRYFAIAAGSLAAIDALLEIPSYPILSLAMFALSLWIIHGLTIEADDSSFWESQPSSQASIPYPAAAPPP
jgi:hypothetical protein